MSRKIYGNYYGRLILLNKIIIKINNMFKIKENDLFSKNMSGSELYKTTKMGKDNSKKLVTDYDKVSFDKWMNDLIDRNGVTKY